MDANKLLELRFPKIDYGLSARRLWEHTELGQINVFKHSISERSELNDATNFIDLIHFRGNNGWLVGLTLAEYVGGHIQPNSGLATNEDLKQLFRGHSVQKFTEAVAAHIDRFAIRRALRDQQHHFLPAAGVDDCFGVPYIFSTLKRRLQSMGKQKADGDQWVKTIDNFRQSGMREEEFECAQLIPDLSPGEGNEEQYTALRLADMCYFKDLRISVLPVVKYAEHQLQFSEAPERALKRTKRLPKSQYGQVRGVAGFDPVLGYRIEEIKHQTLWGEESHWQAVTHDGTVIESHSAQNYFPTKEAALALASSHAKSTFPKRMSLGKYGQYAWTGGESYREWLITLPYYPQNYLSGHFKVRNVLAHIRCDGREGADGERILMLQEVQSDWAQGARRAASEAEPEVKKEEPPPFMKEWSALAMKLVLLHAANYGWDAVAWTKGEHQATRYLGLGAVGLKELYDRTLPREVNRILKPFGVVCGTVGVFVPDNFIVKQTEAGYEVYSQKSELLGISRSFEGTREFVPDQGHELVRDVHGVRLNESTRAAILNTGFPAWG